MSRIVLVRHGQASFGADDYDALSLLGHRQCHLLGEHFRREAHRFGTVMRGTLQRHAQSLAALEGGLAVATEPDIRPTLNEYDSEALIKAIHDGPLSKPRSLDQAREHFRLLREALLRWMDGSIEPRGMPRYADFRDGIADALRDARQASRASDVLIVSSGGPISCAVGQVMGLTPESQVALNMRLANSGVVQLASTARGLELVSFNTLPHLAGQPNLVTHA